MTHEYPPSETPWADGKPSLDHTLLSVVMRPHGVTSMSRGLMAASLDHALWFHRDFRVDEWLLYDQVSPAAFGGRGLALGRFFTREGMLVASVAQESLVRRSRRASAENR